MELNTPSLAFRKKKGKILKSCFHHNRGFTQKLPTVKSVYLVIFSLSLSLSSCVPSLFSLSIVPPLQQAVCFSVACCRGSECSAVSSRTKGYESATIMCVRQQLQGPARTAGESVCVTRIRPDPFLPSSRRGLVQFGSAETLGRQLQAACVNNSLIHTDLIFF